MDVRESATMKARELVGFMDPEKKIETCLEWTRWRFRGLLFSLALAGYGKARVICGARTYEEQVKLFGLGRSFDEMSEVGLERKYAHPGRDRVTWINPSMSMHVVGRAIDVDLREYEGSTMAPIGDICRQLRITWGGEWSVRDYAHFEL